jgi:Icc-related predicted phosphoesterase
MPHAQPKETIPMKIQLASDLHLELLQERFPGERLLARAPEANLLVLAGDIANGTQAIDLFRDWPVPVLYVAGNHEFYNTAFEQARAELRRAAQGTSITFLDNDAVEIAGVRFLGSTLWTDYRFPPGHAQTELMENAERFIYDHRRIRIGSGLFTAAAALDENLRARAWLAEQLARPHADRTVVITHHAPHPLSVHPRFEGSPINASFANDGLDDLLKQADLWLHGHMHDSFDYAVHGCRVVVNPRGYAKNRRQAMQVGELEFENPAFRPACVIDVHALS